MFGHSSPALSIVVPFADHEDVLGAACRRVADHCRRLELTFELLAVDEGSGDNCRALLSLLRSELPELRVVTAPGPHRAFMSGAAVARGRALLLIEPHAASRSIAAIARAVERVRDGVDVVILPNRFVMARRTRALSILDPARARGFGFERRLTQRAERKGLAVEIWSTGGGPDLPRARRPGRVARLFEVLLFAASR